MEGRLLEAAPARRGVPHAAEEAGYDSHEAFHRLDAGGARPRE